MFRQGVPIYRQIKEIIAERIISGAWKENELIPSVRNMAKELGVNPNTVMRTVSELQNEKVLILNRGIGNLVSPGARDMLKKGLIKKFIENEVPVFVAKAKTLEINKQKLVTIIEGEW